MRNPLKIVPLFGMLFVFAATAATAQQPASSLAAAAKELRSVGELTVSAELGYVTESRQPQAQLSREKSPSIIHIQEAHTNYEGQKHLAEILADLINRYGIKLVLVEGGEGDVSLSYLRASATAQKRKEIADKYLKESLISGEESLDLTSDFPLMLWGVENRSLYDENVKAFLRVKKSQVALAASLKQVAQTAKSLASSLQDPILIELDAKAEALERDGSTLPDYAEALARAAQQSGLTLPAESAMSRFQQARALEKTINREELNKEQSACLRELSRFLPAQEMNALIEQAYAMKTGKLKREVFYQALADAAAAADRPLASYPHLERYIQYQRLSSAINPQQLSDELGRVARQVRERLLSGSDQSRRLAAVQDQLDLVTKLVELKLTPDEYRRIKAQGFESFAQSWQETLGALLEAKGQPRVVFSGLEVLAAEGPAFRQFYESAEARDAALVENSLAKLKETGESVAVLITGGFHGPEITRRLGEKGIGVVVVVPRVSKATDEALYEAVLKCKSGVGTQEDVLKLVNPENNTR